MDWIGTVVVPILNAVAPVVASVAAAWIITRRITERSETKSEIRTAERDDLLRRLDHTRASFLNTTDHLLARRRKGEMGPVIEFPKRSETPFEAGDMVGDQAILDRLAIYVRRMEFDKEFDFENDDFATNLKRDWLAAIDEQRGRAMRYEPLKANASWPDAEKRAKVWWEGELAKRAALGTDEGAYHWTDSSE